MPKRANERTEQNRISARRQLKIETNNRRARHVINLDPPAAGGGAWKMFAAAGSDLFMCTESNIKAVCMH
jgi:hypothetical protein